jgi:hypothetical protein
MGLCFGKYKKSVVFVIVLITLLLFQLSACKKEDGILAGYWNNGLAKNAIFNGYYGEKIFARTNDFILFDFGKKQKAIKFNIGKYLVKKIDGAFPKYDVIILEREHVFPENNPAVYFTGHIRIEFQGDRQMSISLIKDGQTDDNFSISDFVEEGKKYWKANELKIPLKDPE